MKTKKIPFSPLHFPHSTPSPGLPVSQSPSLSQPHRPSRSSSSYPRPMVPLLLLSLRHTSNSRNMFSRFFDRSRLVSNSLCASSTEARTSRPRAFQAQFWVATRLCCIASSVLAGLSASFSAWTWVPVYLAPVSSSHKNPEYSHQNKTSMSPSFRIILAGSAGASVPHTRSLLESGCCSRLLPYCTLFPFVCVRWLTLRQRLYVLSFDAVTWGLLQAGHTGLGIRTLRSWCWLVACRDQGMDSPFCSRYSLSLVTRVTAFHFGICQDMVAWHVSVTNLWRELEQSKAC